MKKEGLIYILAIFGAASIYAVCFNLDICPCVEIAECNSYPDAAGFPYTGSTTPGSVGYAGLVVSVYPSGVIDGQPTGWNNSEGFTTTTNWISPCGSASQIVFYSGPDCTGDILITVKGVEAQREASDFTLPPGYNADCEIGG